MNRQIQFPSRVIPTARENSRFSKYRYPLDLGPNGIVFDFAEYSYKRTTQGVNPKSRTKTSIVLPLPQEIQDAYNIILNSADLGVGGSFIIDQFSQGDVDAVKNQITKILNNTEAAGAMIGKNGLGSIIDAFEGGGRYAKFISRSILDSLPINGLSLAADVITGSAVNPHTTLNFDGVELKNFTFNWQFAPRSEKESAQLRDIIKKIKYHSLPKYSTLPGQPESGSRTLDRALLKYPDLVLTRFNGIAQDHYFEFRPAMINNVSVNYSPQGNVIFEGGRPAMVNLTITMTEAQIHTSGQGSTDTSITSDTLGGGGR